MTSRQKAIRQARLNADNKLGFKVKRYNYKKRVLSNFYKPKVQADTNKKKNA